MLYTITQLQSSNCSYRVLNIDVCIVLDHQHASNVDMTPMASQHKSRVSILPTYNNSTSYCRLYTQYKTKTTTSSTASQNYIYHDCHAKGNPIDIKATNESKISLTEQTNSNTNRTDENINKYQIIKSLNLEYTTPIKTKCNGAIKTVQ